MNIILFDYDSSHDPSAPFVEIEINGYDPQKGTRTLWAMVDSGADATMIPLRTLKSIGAQYQERRFMSGVTSERTSVNIYNVSIKILPNGYLAGGVKVVARPDSNEALVGRDVLNQLEITLNGPGESIIIRND
ncbi:MAG: aspartyl protease family protein [Chloroflexota bacterium]